MKIYRGTVAQVANQAITDWTRRQFGPRRPSGNGGGNGGSRRQLRDAERFDRWVQKQAFGLGHRFPHEKQ